MSIPKSVISRLNDSGVEYQLVDIFKPMSLAEAAQYLSVKSAQLLRVVGLKSESRLTLAVLPYESMLDVGAITEQTDTDYKILSSEEMQKYFKSCDENSFPPIPQLFDCQFILDQSVLDMPQVIMQSGHGSQLIELDKFNSNLLFQECENVSLAVTRTEFMTEKGSVSEEEPTECFTSLRMKQRINETFDLPTMPEIAQDIMKLRVDPCADAAGLANIVCRDPSLASQLISWASSPYYGYQGKIDSVQTAIARVLGFELVMNLALGISIGKSLRVPLEGPLGLKSYWKHAIYCANLSEKLCCNMPVKQRPERGLIYLSGLLHSFGHLLLGHIFPPQFKLINTAVEANPHIPIEMIEQHILGVTHQEIGAWLMKNWHMPEELIVAVKYHSEESFWNKHAIYSNTILVANKMLNQINQPHSTIEIPASMVELLSIDHETALSALEAIQSDTDALDSMANQLVA